MPLRAVTIRSQCVRKNYIVRLTAKNVGPEHPAETFLPDHFSESNDDGGVVEHIQAHLWRYPRYPGV